MGDGSPTRRGIARGATPPRPRTRRLRASSKPLFWTTRAVIAASPAASGIVMIETVPTIMLPMYCSEPSAPPRVGLGPRGLGPAPSPFELVTYNVRPSPATVTVVGYQAVGINPTTIGDRPARSATATSSLPAFATNSQRPSGLTARPSGTLPSGAPG